jgi:hypothetical protein
MSILKTLTINGTTYNVTPVVPASSVTLLASAWVGDGESYSQVVTIPGVTAHTKVDLQPTSDQLAEFHYKVLSFVAENNGGVVTVYAIGDKPTGDHTIQITKTEVQGTGKIRGNTVGTSMPRPDWNQTDPTKADYIKNKPDISGGGGSGGGTVSNAVLYTAQYLNDDQKEQARKNINAVGKGEDINMYGAAVKHTGLVQFANTALTQLGAQIRYNDASSLNFCDYTGVGNVTLKGIEEGKEANDAVNVAQLNAAIAGVSGGGSGGASALIVTVDGNVANYTVQAIEKHLYKGGVAYLYDAENEVRLPLSIVGESAFASYLDDEGFWHIYEIYNENSVVKAVYEYAVQSQLGDIDTALDRIIEIQNSLIGGGA